MSKCVNASFYNAKKGEIRRRKIILKDKQGNEYFSNIPKDIFEQLPYKRPVELEPIKNLSCKKKILKGFLEIKEEI